MTEKEFLNALANDRTDVIQILLNALAQAGADYCVIGGLAVNAYAEPVASLDLDIVIAVKDIEALCAAVAPDFKIERFPHSVNLTSPDSDLRVQIQTDDRYQDFLPSATERDVLGYRMRVAALEDVLRGKLWAWSDAERRPSKRQKDLADIMRLAETHPRLVALLPDAIRDQLR